MSAVSEPVALSALNPLYDLVAVMRSQRRALGFPQTAVDHIAGLPDGYQGKLEASLTNPSAKNARSIGKDSLPLLLGALGLRLLVVESKAMPATSEHSAGEKIAQVDRFFVERARAGARGRNASMSPEQRSASARAAAQARWRSKTGEAI